jgi:hypothetical protein
MHHAWIDLSCRPPIMSSLSPHARFVLRPQLLTLV